MEINLKNKEVEDFVFYLGQQEERWKYQDNALKLIKNYAKNLLTLMESSVDGNFLLDSQLLESVEGTLKIILESIDGLKKMEGIPRETD